MLYDDGEGLTAPAAERLAALGYSPRSTVFGARASGGWVAAGYELFQDVNSASKAFGELVEARRHTPSCPPPKAKALIEARADVVVLDARQFRRNHRTMSIPTGVSVPGAELVLRARALAPDPATTIIVNCAGRTRSLIGAQSLINAGLPNPVFALRNGSIGWTLASQSLEHGQSPPLHPSRGRRGGRRESAGAPVEERAPWPTARACAIVGWARSDLAQSLEADPDPHPLPVRRSPTGRVRGGPPARLHQCAGRPVGPGDRSRGAGARRAHRAGRSARASAPT